MGDGGASSGGPARVPVVPPACAGVSLCVGKQRAGKRLFQQNEPRGSSQPHLCCSFRSLSLQPACAYPIRLWLGAPRLKQPLEDVWDQKGNPVHPGERPFGAGL